MERRPLGRLFYADVMDQEEFIMNNIIKDLRAALAREDELNAELPDGSNITVSADDAPDDASEQVFNDEVETLALENDIDIDEKVLEALLVNGEVLTDIDLALESFKYSGLAMDDLTYTALQRTYNKIAGEFRLPAIESMMVDYEGDRTLVRLATEATVTKRASDVLQKIVDTIMSLFAKIRDWYIRVFDQAALQKRRALKIIKVAGSITGAPVDANVTLKSVRTIGINNKPVQPSPFLNGMLTVANLTDKLTGDVAKEYNQILGELTTLTKTQVAAALEQNEKRTDETLSTSRNDVEVPKVFVKNDDKMMLKLVADFKKMMEMLDLSKVPPEDDARFSAPNTVYHLSDMLPGSKQLSTAYPDKPEETVSDLGKIKNSFGIGVIEVDLKDKGPAKEVAFDTLSIVDVKRIAEQCVKLCDHVILYKTNYSETEKRTDRFLKELKTLTRGQNDIDATARQSILSITSGATAINKNMMNGTGRWIRYVMDLIVSTLEWCTESLAQYDHGKM